MLAHSKLMVTLALPAGSVMGTPGFVGSDLGGEVDVVERHVGVGTGGVVAAGQDGTSWADVDALVPATRVAGEDARLGRSEASGQREGSGRCAALDQALEVDDAVHFPVPGDSEACVLDPRVGQRRGHPRRLVHAVEPLDATNG